MAYFNGGSYGNDNQGGVNYGQGYASGTGYAPQFGGGVPQNSYGPPGYDGNAGVSGSGGGNNSSNDMMFQMGMQFGKEFLQQNVGSLHEHRQTLVSQYLPFVSHLSRFFAVDNNYVKKKLPLMFFPFLNKYVPLAGSGSNNSSSPSQFSYDEPGFGSPVTLNPSAAPGNTAAGGRAVPLPALPSQYLYAFDLYIPLMAVMTYIVISAGLFGLVTGAPLTSDVLLRTASVMAGFLVAELTVSKILKAVMLAGHNNGILSVLESLSIQGYKYVTVSVYIILRYAFGMFTAATTHPRATANAAQAAHDDADATHAPQQQQRFGPSPSSDYKLFSGKFGLSLAMLMYFFIANSFVIYKCLCLSFINGSGGTRVTKKVRVFAIAVALVQFPATIWMGVRPF